MDYIEAQEEIMSVKRNECPHCHEPLEHFGGLADIPECLYCPRCVDMAWNFGGERIARLE